MYNDSANNIVSSRRLSSVPSQEQKDQTGDRSGRDIRAFRRGKEREEAYIFTQLLELEYKTQTPDRGSAFLHAWPGRKRKTEQDIEQRKERIASHPLVIYQREDIYRDAPVLQSLRARNSCRRILERKSPTRRRQG